MKARIPFHSVNPRGSAAMMKEIKAQCVEINREYELELDALVLWTLHTEQGWGLKRLLQFYEALIQERKQLHDFYTSDTPTKDEAGIEYFAAAYHLKNYGLDIEAEYAKLSKKYSL